MRQRIEQLGGEFAVTSTDGSGSRVSVAISAAAISAVASRPPDDAGDDAVGMENASAE
jgi:hypothetical protein